jgi:hypothetical protein
MLTSEFRGVAMLHKLPVVLRPNTIFPWQSGHLPNDQVLPAFVKLVHLFWVFDQSGIFELLRNSDADVSSMESLARGCLELLQHKLQDLSTGDGGFGNDVQRADMCVTRQWMRAVLWRAALRFGIVVPGTNPIDVAGEFLSLVSQLPTSALESQGQTLVGGLLDQGLNASTDDDAQEFKTYEIATAVVDAVAEHYPVLALGRPRDVLGGLYGILASSRGGNKTLLSLLNSKLATSHPDLRILIQPSSLPPADQTPAGATMSQSAETWDFAAGEGVIGQYSEDRDLQSAMADLSWPPLDLGNLLRSPSPVTRLLLDNAMANQQLPMG